MTKLQWHAIHALEKEWNQYINGIEVSPERKDAIRSAFFVGYFSAILAKNNELLDLSADEVDEVLDALSEHEFGPDYAQSRG